MKRRRFIHATHPFFSLQDESESPKRVLYMEQSNGQIFSVRANGKVSLSQYSVDDAIHLVESGVWLSYFEEVADEEEKT